MSTGISPIQPTCTKIHMCANTSANGMRTYPRIGTNRFIHLIDQIMIPHESVDWHLWPLCECASARGADHAVHPNYSLARDDAQGLHIQTEHRGHCAPPTQPCAEGFSFGTKTYTSIYSQEQDIQKLEQIIGMGQIEEVIEQVFRIE